MPRDLDLRVMCFALRERIERLEGSWVDKSAENRIGILGVALHTQSEEMNKLHHIIDERIEKIEEKINKKPELSYSPEGVQVFCESLLVPIWNEINALKKSQEQRAHLINYKSYLALADRIDSIEKHVYSFGDINAIQGQIDNVHKNNEFDNHFRNRLEDRVIALEEKLQDIKIYSEPLQAQAWQQNIINRLEKLEKWKVVAIEKNIQDVHRIRELEDIIKGVEVEPQPISIPIICSACNGQGKFWPLNSIGYHLCKACEGRGKF